jgi:hypothetical protein
MSPWAVEVNGRPSDPSIAGSGGHDTYISGIVEVVQLRATMKRTYLNIPAVIRLTTYCFLALTSLVCSPILARQSANASSPRQSPPDFRIASGKGFVKVPFDFYLNTILLQVRVNNSPPVRLVLDTGANLNIINQRLFESLGLNAKGTADLSGGGGTVQGQLAEGATLSLPGVEAYKQTIASAPLDDMPAFFGRDVQGLLGTPFIKNFVLEIDYAGKTLTFYDPKVYNLKDSREALELEGRSGRPFAEVELSLNGRDKVTDKFMLDTGSNRIFQINGPFAEAHRLLSMVPRANTAEGVGEAIGGRVSFTEARISSIRIGKHVIRRPVVSIYRGTTGADAGADAGVIGGEILRRFTVTLDYQSGKMLLKPNAHFDEPYEVDMSGLELMTGANDFKAILIKDVRAGTPAAEAGLREGDVVVSINGRPASEFDLDKLSKIFRQGGKEYLLTVRRDGKVISARLRLKRIV